MNTNKVIDNDWSNFDSRRLYEGAWPDERHVRLAYEQGNQCGGCTFFAKFNSDWGLCCCPTSRHRFETVFEHFTCPSFVNEGWGPHSFTTDPEFHCRCGGEELESSGG